VAAALFVLLCVALYFIVDKAPYFDVRGKAVLITGGSR
jgi:hypothetical protein